MKIIFFPFCESCISKAVTLNNKTCIRLVNNKICKGKITWLPIFRNIKQYIEEYPKCLINK